MSGSRALLSMVIAFAAIPAQGAQQTGDPLFALAAWQAMPGPMPLPVFEGGAAMAGRHLVILGGCTRELTATQAIQLRHPIHGWLPIGSSLLEPRARATVTTLPNGRLLILGGWQGTWGRDASHHADGEILDPLIAGSSERVPAWPVSADEEASLEGHTATPLADGRVAVVRGRTLRLLDVERNEWSDPLALHGNRIHHAAVRVEHQLILIGGDLEDSIESIDLSEEEPSSLLWSATLPTTITEASAVAAGETFVLLAGGVGPEGSTIDRTYLLDCATRSLRPGPDLGLARGACRLALVPHRRGFLILDGEWRLDGARGNANAAILLRPLASPSERARWALPRLGPHLDTSRRMLVVAPDGSVEVLGGYRFVSPEEGREARQVGVLIEGSGQRLVVDALGTSD